YTEHAGQTSVRAGRRLGGRGALANRRLGLCRLRRFVDALLRNLFEFCDSVAFSSLAPHRLGDCITGRASDVRASEYSCFPRRSRAAGAEPGGPREARAASDAAHGRNFYHGLDPMSLSELAAHLRLSAGMVKEFMEM